jgi:hypothetical protein
MRRMRRPPALTRRRLLERLAVCIPLLPGGRSAIRRALASAAPLLSADSPEAKAVKYVEDAREAPGAAPDSSCASCGLYQGASGSAEGPCQLFPGKDVKASGWCSSWTPQL